MRGYTKKEETNTVIFIFFVTKTKVTGRYKELSVLVLYTKDFII